MTRVLVSVRRSDEARGRDLELPGDIEAQRLSALLARALGWDPNVSGGGTCYHLEVRPPGRILQPDETLVEAGVWDGSWLIVHVAGNGARDTVPPPAGGGPLDKPGGPVAGWRPLGITLPPPPDPGSAPTGDAPAGGYTWKRLDD